MRKQSMKMHTTQRRIHLPSALLAHSDHEIRALLRHALVRAGYEVMTCSDREELLTRLNAVGDFQLLVCEATWLDDPAVGTMCGVPRTQDFGSLAVIDFGNEPTARHVLLLQPDVVVRNPFPVIRHMARIHVEANVDLS